MFLSEQELNGRCFPVAFHHTLKLVNINGNECSIGIPAKTSQLFVRGQIILLFMSFQFHQLISERQHKRRQGKKKRMMLILYGR